MINNLKLILAFTAIIVFMAGCSKTDQKKETTGDNKTGDQTTQQQQQTDNKTTGDQSVTKTEGKNELGIKDGMPPDYPSDVPKPSNSKALGYLSTQEGTVVTFESLDKPKDVLKDFAENLEKGGFKKGEGEMMSDDGGLSTWNKEKREVSIMLAWQKEKNNCSVVVTYK
jgi:hypothetical protein